MPRSIAGEVGDVAAFPFTESKVDALVKAAARGEVRLDADRRRWWRDSVCKQLAIRVSAAGGAAYYRVFKQAGRRIKQHIGDAHEMLVETARANVDRLRLGDTQATRKRAAPGDWTIREAVDAYLAASKAHTFKVGRNYPAENTIKSYFEVARPHLLRPHGDKSLVWLGAHFKSIHATLAAKRPGAADRLRTVVTNVYIYAIAQGRWTGTTPMIDSRTGRAITKPAHVPARERFLTLDEIAKLEAYARTACDPWYDFWMLALLTGVRRGNLRSARWQDIDLNGRIWRIGKTKNGRQHVVPLVSERALEILADRLKRAPKDDSGRPASPWVFPRKTDPSLPIGDTREAWERLQEAVPELADARTHDLRRTCGTLATIAGMPEAAVGAMLGHTPGSTATKVYARINVATKATGFERVAEAIDQAIAPKRKRKPK
jgi:integrase